MPKGTPQSERVRPTKEQYAERVLTARRLLSEGQYDGDIKKMMAKMYNVSPKSVKAYLARARKQIIAASGLTPREFRAQSLAFYIEIRSKPKVDVNARLRAQERIDKLLGLEAPREVLVGDLDAAIERELARLAAAPKTPIVATAPDQPVGTNGHAG